MQKESKPGSTKRTLSELGRERVERYHPQGKKKKEEKAQPWGSYIPGLRTST